MYVCKYVGSYMYLQLKCLVRTRQMPTRQVLCKRANYLQSSRTHTTPHIYYIYVCSCVCMYMKVKAIFDKHQLFSPRRSLWKFPTAESCPCSRGMGAGGVCAPAH